MGFELPGARPSNSPHSQPLQAHLLSMPICFSSGLYIGWRCPEYLWDCFRVGDESKCFCGHLLKLHQVYVGE